MEMLLAFGLDSKGLSKLLIYLFGFLKFWKIIMNLKRPYSLYNNILYPLVA